MIYKTRSYKWSGATGSSSNSTSPVLPLMPLVSPLSTFKWHHSPATSVLHPNIDCQTLRQQASIQTTFLFRRTGKKFTKAGPGFEATRP